MVRVSQSAAESGEADELTLQRSPAQRRKMLLIAVPIMLLGFAAIWLGFFTRAGLPLGILGVLFMAPVLWVLDQGYVIVQLTPRGFTVRRAGSSLSVPWDDVERFYVQKVPSLGGSGKIASVAYRQQERVFPRNRRALAGYIMAVCMDPEAEVELLESWRRRWSKRPV